MVGKEQAEEMDIGEVELSHLQEAYRTLKDNPHLCWTTPYLENLYLFKDIIPDVKSFSMKLETMQCTGSFKARGAAYRFLTLPAEDIRRKRCVVTLTCGNFGIAVAHMSQKFQLPAVVFMPDSAPLERRQIIEAYGAVVHQGPLEQVISHAKKHQREHRSLFLSSYDDPTLIIGNASAALELMQQATYQPDVILVCCGGGGFLAGVSLGVKLNGWESTKVYGVEPEKGAQMYKAMKAGYVVETPYDSTCFVKGLNVPYVGGNAFRVVKEYVEDILLVSDDEVKLAVKALHERGLVAEPAGAAAFAALMSGKVPDVQDKHVTVFLTGRNATARCLSSCLVMPGAHVPC